MSNFDDENFDPKTYIEETYQNASIHDLNSALNLININLDKAEKESKALVSQHFNKFIECRSVLESIHIHATNNSEIKKLRSVMPTSLNNLSLPEYNSIKRKKELQTEFKHIFNLKENLKNANSYEEILLCNKCAFSDLQRAANSQYLNMLYKEGLDERIVFCNNMCEEIEKSANKFGEMFNYFDLYFEMDKIINCSNDDEFNVPETMNAQECRQKMENTILVNAKILLLKLFEGKDFISFVDETKYGLIKILESEMSSEIKKELIGVYLGIFKRHVKNNDVDMMKYAFMKKELEDLIGIINSKVNESVKYYFLTAENEFIHQIVEHILYSSIKPELTTEEWSLLLVKNIKKAIKISKKGEKSLLQKIVRDILINRISTNKGIEEVRHIKETLLDKISIVLKLNMTQMKPLYDEFQQYEENEVDEIINEYEYQLDQINKIKYESEDSNKNNDKLLCNTMLFVLKIIDKYPRSYVKVLNRISNKIVSNGALYFLKDVCYNSRIKMSEDDKICVDKYEKMFGFLSKKDDLDQDEDKGSFFINDTIRKMIDDDAELRIDQNTTKSKIDKKK